MKLPFTLIGGGLILVVMTAPCTAQLFGQRSLGQPLSRRSAANLANDSGTLQGGERFLRAMRSVADFVGIDARDRARFVGQVAAQNQLEAIESAISESRRTDRTAQINMPLRAKPVNGMREPVLELGFEPAPENNARLVEQVQIRLSRILSERFGSPIEVWVEDRTATLRGEVDAVELARLAEILAALEPGITKVQNLLTVKSAAAPESPIPDLGRRP
jgi:osmotically-inducible protein OsmY